MTGRALRAIRARLLAADGVTLSEMLAVLVSHHHPSAA